MSCGVGLHRGLNPALLWLWFRPLHWDLPYAVGAALKRQKKKKEEEKESKVLLEGPIKKIKYIIIFLVLEMFSLSHKCGCSCF